MPTTQPLRRSLPFDAATILHSGLVGASGAGTKSGNPVILPVGDAPFAGIMVVNVSAIEIDTGNEKYGIVLQGSASATFASGIENLTALDLGAAASGRWGGARDSVVGRYELRFLNVQRYTTFPYLRIYNFVSGTVATGINYEAYLVPNA